MARLRDLDAVTTPISLTADRGYLIQPTGGSPAWANKAWTSQLLLGAAPQRPGGILTVVDDVPHPSGDHAAQQVLRYVVRESPFADLSDGTRWKRRWIPDDLHVALSGLFAGKNQDVFLVPDGADSVALELGDEWTDDTTRSAPLDPLDGLRVLDGDPTRLFVGTIRAVTSTTTCDIGGMTTSMTVGRRFVANEYHRKIRPVGFFDSGADFGSPYDYGGTLMWRSDEWLTVRRDLTNDAWEVHVLVLGQQDVDVQAVLVQTANTMGNSGGYPKFGIALDGGGPSDGTTPVPAQAFPINIGSGVGIQAAYGTVLRAAVPITTEGYHRISVVYRHQSNADATMVCDDVTNKQIQTGLIAMVEN